MHEIETFYQIEKSRHVEVKEYRSNENFTIDVANIVLIRKIELLYNLDSFKSSFVEWKRRYSFLMALYF